MGPRRGGHPCVSPTPRPRDGSPVRPAGRKPPAPLHHGRRASLGAARAPPPSCHCPQSAPRPAPALFPSSCCSGMPCPALRPPPHPPRVPPTQQGPAWWLCAQAPGPPAVPAGRRRGALSAAYTSGRSPAQGRPHTACAALRRCRGAWGSQHRDWHPRAPPEVWRSLHVPGQPPPALGPLRGSACDKGPALCPPRLPHFWGLGAGGLEGGEGHPEALAAVPHVSWPRALEATTVQ